MAQNDFDRWQKKYAALVNEAPGPAADFLVAIAPRLGAPGRALDLAAGDGRNAIYLAERGWRVTAVDISPLGLGIGQRVGPAAATIEWIIADLDDYAPDPEAFDLVVCFRFLDRQRLPALVERALRPGGLLVAETYNQREAERPGSHLKNPAYWLQPDEWPRLFPEYETIVCEEVDVVSRLVARKPMRASPAAGAPC